MKPSSLGDVVHTIPSVSLIARAHPRLAIRWLVNPEWAPLIEDLPWLTSTLPFPRHRFRGVGGLIQFLMWRGELRASLPALPDAALDFQGLLRSGLASAWSRAPVRVGLSDSREGACFFHTDVVEVDRQAHAVDRCLALVQALGIPIPDDLPWELPEGARISEQAFGGTPPEQSIILHPFSRGDGKSLTTAQVVQFCIQCGNRDVIIVGHGDSIRGLPGNAHDLTNRTSLAQLVWLMRRAGMVVSVDSGPMHIAAAANPRVIGIHTWSDPCKVGPYRPEAWVFKGGQFFHRAACPVELRSARCPITDDDVGTIAAFAVERLNERQ